MRVNTLRPRIWTRNKVMRRNERALSSSFIWQGAEVLKNWSRTQRRNATRSSPRKNVARLLTGINWHENVLYDLCCSGDSSLFLFQVCLQCARLGCKEISCGRATDRESEINAVCRAYGPLLYMFVLTASVPRTCPPSAAANATIIFLLTAHATSSAPSERAVQLTSRFVIFQYR